MKNSIQCLLFLTMASFSMALPAQQAGSTNEKLIVGYYGRPGTASLGVLGQHSIDELMPLIKAKADEYDQLNGDAEVQPAFHLIYGLAAADPGRNKDYLLPLSDKKVMEYITVAKNNGFLVIIDTQLGAKTPVEAVKPVLKYLKYDNVHLAIDPEFEVHGLDVRPGKIIGHITGDEVNEVQSAMTNYMTENSIKGTKILIVHMFTQNMVQDRESIKPYEQIKLVMNLDGHGSPQLKVKTYNSLFTSKVQDGVAGGFKLFFQEDKPEMMTPRQVLALEPVGKTTLKRIPSYINYQ